MGWVVRWDELSVGMGCPLGRVVRWDGLSIGTSCPLGRAVHWDGLSVGTGCQLGRVVLGWAVLGRVVRWDGLSAGTGCPLGRVVLEPFYRNLSRSGANFCGISIWIKEDRTQIAQQCNSTLLIVIGLRNCYIKYYQRANELMMLFLHGESALVHHL